MEHGYSVLPLRPLTGGWLLQTISYSDTSTWGDSNKQKGRGSKRLPT